MQEIKMRAKPALPYCMFLTMMFHDFGVGVVGELCKILQHYDIYNEKSMKRMGFLKIEGQWVREGEEEKVEVCRSPYHIL